MKYDIFTFFNELDLLEIRLNILYKQVDYFIIVECAETFSGLKKKLYYKENQIRFKKFADKIVHYEVTNVPISENELRQRLQQPHLNQLDREIIQQALTSDNVPKNQLHWLKEFYQKESIKKALINLQDDDICFVGDVDEIWNPDVVIDYTKSDIYKLKQKVYSYYLNNRSDEPWAGTLVSQYRNIKNNCLNHLRTASKTHYTYIENGGWHFTNQGGIEQIKRKLESYGHQEFNTKRIKTRLNKQIKHNRDFIGRHFKFWLDESELPAYLLDHKSDYIQLFKQSDSVIIKLQGGLGNQLFQYAVGRNLALQHKIIVEYDLSWFSSQSKRQYLLNKFKTLICLAHPQQVDKLMKYQVYPGKKNFFHNWFIANDKKYILENTFTHNKKIHQVVAPAYLDGYWQSYKYFADISQPLIAELKLKDPLSQSAQAILEIIKSTNAISLHVRRGDYVSDPNTQSFHGSPSLHYYKEAIQYIKQKVSDPVFFIFSDDIVWTQNHLSFLPVNTVYVSNHNIPDYEEMVLMSHCHHHIIANSSFSWWGAWLNPSPNKIVVRPNQWFNDQTINTDDLLPKTWISL